jgi:NAD(P)-dependent dehydrogenase (short-subunit alcohol dehydrogenase family)
VELSGKVALVTGGSRGLGREMALAFAQRGANVVIASRKLAACEAVAEQIEQTCGRRALPVACHVGEWSQCDQLVDAAYEHFGRVDVLVNNAGMSLVYESLPAVTREMFDKVIAVNLAGSFRLSAVLGTRMVSHGGGSIINISSMAAIRPTPDTIPYAAAKAGVNATTKGLAQALGPTVRVNCIQAGPFRTDIAAAWDPAEVEKLTDGLLALRRVGEPGEIVGAAVFFASDASSYCTGSILEIDGGRA